MAERMVEPKSVLSAREVILWWEWRRLLYNAILLVIGLATIVGFEFIMSRAIPPGQDVQDPMNINGHLCLRSRCKHLLHPGLDARVERAAIRLWPACGARMEGNYSESAWWLPAW